MVADDDKDQKVEVAKISAKIDAAVVEGFRDHCLDRGFSQRLVIERLFQYYLGLPPAAQDLIVRQEQNPELREFGIRKAIEHMLPEYRTWRPKLLVPASKED